LKNTNGTTTAVGANVNSWQFNLGDFGMQTQITQEYIPMQDEISRGLFAKQSTDTATLLMYRIESIEATT
jgi:hypothetical protein